MEKLLLSRLQKQKLLLHDLESGKLKTVVKHCRWVDVDGHTHYRQVLGTDDQLLAKARADLHQLKLFLTASGIKY